MTGLVRTVLGDLPATDLGRVDYHEHLFQRSRLLPGDDLNDETRSGREAARLFAAGLSAMIEATPIGLGRNPHAVARISASTGLRVVATTGAHRQEHYPPEHWLLDCSPAELVRRFTDDIAVGTPIIDDDPNSARQADDAVRAGVVKAGIGYWSITEFERRVLGAVAETHARTGAPVMVHLEHGSAAHEVLDIVCAEGVAESAVVLAHIDRNPDHGLHAELAGRGAYLGYDGAARHRSWPDSIVLDCLVAAAAGGAAERILLGGDVARSSRYIEYGGMPGLAYLPERFVPRLAAHGGSELVDAILQTNPQRYLGRF
jgi:predicted metal-dependent phosphotriesterase family hydrolase